MSKIKRAVYKTVLLLYNFVGENFPEEKKLFDRLVVEEFICHCREK